MQKRVNTEITKETLMATERDTLLNDVITRVSGLQKSLINSYITNWYNKAKQKAKDDGAAS